MRVLIACAFSGIERDFFTALGHDAWSCDLLPSELPGKHYLGDVRDILDDGWDLMIAHPDCKYLSSSGLHWNGRVPGRAQLTLDALYFVRLLMNAPIQKIAIENPIGRINTAIRAPEQYIQPYDYGDDASKRTGLWLKGLPPLRPTKRIAGRIVMHNGKLVERWANQTDSGQNRLGPSPDRWKERSRTYAGWADAFASQWGAA
jgi:hypothetical protein